MTKQLIIVSNRLPFKLEKKGDSFDVRQSSGGLVTALLTLKADDMALSWVGVADFKREVWESAKDRIILPSCALKPIFTDKKQYHQYYNGFSNATIWPLFHYFPSYAEYDEANFDAYRQINRQFAEEINLLAKPGDMIWIHDYHLMLLPKYLKEIRNDLKVGFFLHIPFPSYEIMKLLPGGWRGELLNSLANADTIGFHTQEYLSHFKKSLAFFSDSSGEGIPGTNKYQVRAKEYPIGIDFNKFHDAFEIPGVRRGREAIRKKNKDRKIIFSVDRLDYTKGVINRLQAYEGLLEKNKEWHNKVVFIINVVPSRDEMIKYAERKKLIEENIGRINGLYGNVHWQPIIYQYRHLSFNQLLSFYTSADIALITPLRDGMNLVAKEFVASRKDKKGVLILSEFAGAASELHNAILINPNDVEMMKTGLLKALSYSEEEERENMELMQCVLSKNNIDKWTSSFLEDLNDVNNGKLSSAAACNDF